MQQEEHLMFLCKSKSKSKTDREIKERDQLSDSSWPRERRCHEMCKKRGFRRYCRKGTDIGIHPFMSKKRRTIGRRRGVPKAKRQSALEVSDSGVDKSSR